MLVGDLEQATPTREPAEGDAAAAPELRLGIEELVKVALDQSRRTDDASQGVIDGATAVFAVVGNSRTSSTTESNNDGLFVFASERALLSLSCILLLPSPKGRALCHACCRLWCTGSTLFTLFFERHHMRPQPDSWPPEALQWGFGLQGYVSKSNANRMDALLLASGGLLLFVILLLCVASFCGGGAGGATCCVNRRNTAWLCVCVCSLRGDSHAGPRIRSLGAMPWL